MGDMGDRARFTLGSFLAIFIDQIRSAVPMVDIRVAGAYDRIRRHSHSTGVPGHQKRFVHHRARCILQRRCIKHTQQLSRLGFNTNHLE